MVFHKAFMKLYLRGGLKDNKVKVWEVLSTQKKSEIDNLAKKNNALTCTLYEMVRK